MLSKPVAQKSIVTFKALLTQVSEAQRGEGQGEGAAIVEGVWTVSAIVMTCLLSC